MPNRKPVTGNQRRYIRYLEDLTGMKSKGSQSPATRIRQLHEEAKRLKIPGYKWGKKPVKQFFDPNAKRPIGQRKAVVDKATREYFVQPYSGNAHRQETRNGGNESDDRQDD